MKVIVLTGGVGGAKFLLGARQYVGRCDFPRTDFPDIPTSNATNISKESANNQSSDTTDNSADKTSHNFISPRADQSNTEFNGVIAIVNVGDDAWMHGVRITPDLDSCMYTLGGGIDTERGWGREHETFHAQEELAAYHAQPDWFGLGDRDLGTHLIRTQMLHAGYPLSDITAALCKRWDPGVQLIPATNHRQETHVIVAPNPEDLTIRKAIHFQQWWVKERAQIPTFGFVPIGEESVQPTPGLTEHLATADIIFFAPSNPVVSIGAILHVPGIRSALRQTNAPIIGYSPVIGGKALRGMAEICLSVEGYGSSSYDIAQYYGAKKHGGLLDGWLVDSQDADLAAKIFHDIGIPTRAIPLLMTDAHATAQMVAEGFALAQQCNS